jgi:hypothetical protein
VAHATWAVQYDISLGNLRIQVRSDRLVLVSRTDSVGIVDVDPHDFEV